MTAVRKEALDMQQKHSNLTNWHYMYYYLSVKESKRKPNISIRINPETLHQARVAAVSAKKTLGAWLEEAIQEKIAKGVSQ